MYNFLCFLSSNVNSIDLQILCFLYIYSITIRLYATKLKMTVSSSICYPFIKPLNQLIFVMVTY